MIQIARFEAGRGHASADPNSRTHHSNPVAQTSLLPSNEPAALETSSVWHHLRGLPVLVTTISLSLLLTTSLRVAVQESPLLSVTMMGVPAS